MVAQAIDQEVVAAQLVERQHALPRAHALAGAQAFHPLAPDGADFNLLGAPPALDFGANRARGIRHAAFQERIVDHPVEIKIHRQFHAHGLLADDERVFAHIRGNHDPRAAAHDLMIEIAAAQPRAQRDQDLAVSRPHPAGAAMRPAPPPGRQRPRRPAPPPALGRSRPSCRCRSATSSSSES